MRDASHSTARVKAWTRYSSRRRRTSSPLGLAGFGLVAAVAVLSLLDGQLSCGSWAQDVGNDAAQEVRGLQVMRAIEDSNHDVMAEAVRFTMVLTDKGGRSVSREAGMWFLKTGEPKDETGDTNVESYSMIRFESPPDLRGTAFLTREGLSNDDQWLYLPALGRVKRIAASGRSGSFAGTEISYEDLSRRSVDDYRHRLLRVEWAGEDSIDVVESVPIDEHSGYSRIVSRVSRTMRAVLRAEYYDRNGHLLKTSESLEFFRPDDLHWRFREAIVENVRSGKSTRLRIVDIDLAADLDPSRFTVEALKGGW